MLKTVISSEEKTRLILDAIENRKAVDPVILDVRSRTIIADFFVIASGTSGTHIKAIVDGVMDKLADKGMKNKRVAGYDEAEWVLLDYGDVVVHIFAPEQREFYSLESYWKGAEKGSPPPLHPEERAG